MKRLLLCALLAFASLSWLPTARAIPISEGESFTFEFDFSSSGITWAEAANLAYTVAGTRLAIGGQWQIVFFEDPGDVSGSTWGTRTYQWSNPAAPPGAMASFSLFSGVDGMSGAPTADIQHARLTMLSGSVDLSQFELTIFPLFDEELGAYPWRVAASAVDFNVIPEPASLALLGVGLVALAWTRRAVRAR